MVIWIGLSSRRIIPMVNHILDHGYYWALIMLQCRWFLLTLPLLSGFYSLMLVYILSQHGIKVIGLWYSYAKRTWVWLSSWFSDQSMYGFVPNGMLFGSSFGSFDSLVPFSLFKPLICVHPPSSLALSIKFWTNPVITFFYDWWMHWVVLSISLW